MNVSDNTSNTLDWDEFYRKLSHLYYAIAAMENVNSERLEHLKRIVNKIWADHQGAIEGFQGYTVNKVEALFDWLCLNETDWEYCMDEFESFMKIYRQQMPVSMQFFVLQSAKDLSAALGNPANKALSRLENKMN